MTIVLDGDVRPDEAAAAMRKAGETRVVLAARNGPVAGDVVAALRRAGADPFGIETVEVAGRPEEESSLLLAAARAKLDALPRGERGRATIDAGAVSRRALFSPRSVVTHAPVAVLHERSCVGTQRCALCVERCPENAIAGTTPLPTVDPGACTACGLCVPGCPVGALHLAGSATAQIEAQLEELCTGMHGIVLACAAANADASAGWALVELPTLALVTVGWILRLRARGVDVRVDPCSDPRCAAVAEAVELADRVPVERALLEPLRLSEPQSTAGTLRRISTSVVLESEASPLGLVSLDASACTLCGACALACPADALRLGEGADETALELWAASCVACGRCVRACPEDALTVRRGIDSVRLRRDAVELAWAPRETCSSCGTVLPPRPMRRRLREALPGPAQAALDLCAACAAKGPAQDY